LYARRKKGTFVIRLEDTDDERSDEKYTVDIIDGLKWLGLHWDEGPDIGGPFGPYKQSQKFAHYSQVGNQLVAKGSAYLCYATAEELAALKEEQKNSGKPPRYDNRGRDLAQVQIDQFVKEGRAPSLRFVIEEPRIVAWKDHIKGEIGIETGDLGGDMVIVKSNGIATYNFAVVLDDMDMKISQVIRGEDHIHNTAKQLLLYEALGAKAPEFAHAALIFDTERHKLSKRRHGEAAHIDQYRTDGYMPEAMVNYLTQMSWTPPDGKEVFTLDEASELFELEKVSKSPAVFDLQKLNWFNSHYIRSLPLKTVTERATPYLKEVNLSSYTSAQLEEIVASVRDGLTKLSEVLGATRFYFEKELPVEEELKKTILANGSSRKVIDSTLKELSAFPWGDHKGCKSVVDTMGKELGLKGKELYWPLRVALSGKVQGPDLGSIISILGAERVKLRLQSALPFCGGS
jgi:glutamyl-tRNA synthetase